MYQYYVDWSKLKDDLNRMNFELNKELSKIRVLKHQCVCDCGAVKCKTTHARWCSTMEKK